MAEDQTTGSAQVQPELPSTPREPERPQYDAAFFESLEEGSGRSAAIVADLVVSALDPHSIVDVGCATGLWLAAFRKQGVADTLGVDGPWVDPARFAGPPETFRSHDLTQRVQVERRFDLALCLETAEHLPPERASSLVDDLVALAPLVLFSAAIPGQVGTGHINEQWPSYWRDLFAARNYDCHTALREQLWLRREVEVWYRQNILVFTAPDRTEQVAKALARLAASSAPPLDLVHPDLFARERRNVGNWSRHAEDLEARLRSAESERETIAGELRHAVAKLDDAQARLERLEATPEYRIGSLARSAARKALGFVRSMRAQRTGMQ